MDNARYRVVDLYDAAEWYDVDYAGYRGDDAFYRLVAKPFLGRRVVELGAGTGRVTLSLVEAGHDVLAVEPNEKMAARIAARFARDGARVPPIVHTDAATFVLEDGTAAAVLFPFNGVLHLMTPDAMTAAFSRAHQALAPDGRFAFDVTAPYWEAIAAGPIPWGRMDERVHHLTGAKVLTCDRSRYDGSTRTMHVDIRYLEVGATEGVEVALVQRMWTFQQLLRALDNADFVVDLLFGDVDLSPFHEGAVRMLVSARKR